MRDFRDAKAMAQTLREALKSKSVTLTHSESLELVAKMLGFHDWNVLSAKIQSEGQELAPKIAVPAAPRPWIEADLRGADLPVMAVRDIVIFPYMIVPLFVGRETTIRALDYAMARDRRILIVTQQRSGDDNPARGDLYNVGVTATIIDLTNLPDGTIKVLVKGLRRATIVHLVEAPFLAAEIVPVEESRSKDADAVTLARTALKTLKANSKTGPLSSPYERLSGLEDRAPGIFADTLASLLSAEIRQKQEILEAGDVLVRLQKIMALMQSGRQAA